MMKYCPYCGAVLPTSAVSFCPDCGKPMNESDADNRPRQGIPAKAKIPSQSDKRPPESGRAVSKTPRGNSHTQMKRRPADKRKQNSHVRSDTHTNRCPPPQRTHAAPNPMDVNYDGYYDDIPTADYGQTKEKPQPELIKRVALIAAGTVVIVILSIIIMYVL